MELDEAPYSVRRLWIVAKPLVLSRFPLCWFSHDKRVMSHWGVLITQDDQSTIEALVSEIKHSKRPEYDTAVGELWELTRVGNKNRSKKSRVGLSDMKEWSTISYIGETRISSNKIDAEGPSPKHFIANLSAFRVITDMPDYKLFDQNCQTFAYALVRTIIGDAMYPRTFEHVFLGEGPHTEGLYVVRKNPMSEGMSIVETGFNYVRYFENTYYGG